MPEYVTDAYDLHDFHQNQLDHYRAKAGYKRHDSPVETEQPVFTLGQGTGMPIPGRANVVPQRKPVGKANETAAASRGRSPTPGPSGPRTQSPVPRSRPVSVQSQDGKQIRVMHQDKDGKYTPDNITYQNFRPQDGFTPPASPGPAPRRPESPAPQRVSRRESGGSFGSWRSRGESISKSVRRFSGAIAEKVKVVAMDEAERAKWKQGKQYDQEDENKGKSLPKPALSASEKMAMGVSKSFDGFKRQRGNTNDSDMIGGMTDEAPEGMMAACENCDMPTKAYLKNGLCQRCARRRDRKNGGERTGFVDPWQFPQGRGTWPDVQSPEHGYMKLPRQKRILRIRNTIYEEFMGNPFADEMEDENVAPDTGAAEDIPLPLASQAVENLSPRSRNFRRSMSVAAPIWSPFDRSDEKKVLIASGGGESKEPAPRPRNLHRSMSVAAPSSVPLDKSDEYVPPRKFWRAESMPLGRPMQEAEPSRQSVRDTKFYGFYDDIMTHYKNRESRV